jgi:hypothetical protein
LIEAPHFFAKDVVRPIADKGPFVYISVIRNPEDWFYSAVGQWCAGRGSGTKGGHRPRGAQIIPCRSEAISLHTLRVAGWFEPLAKPKSYQEFGEEHDGVKYYFYSSNLQTKMLGEIFLEKNWIVCNLHSMEVAVEAMSMISAGEMIGEMPRVNSMHWNKIQNFKAKVPWDQIKSFYVTDQALYEHVERKGGCLGHVQDPRMKVAMGEELVNKIHWL